MEEENDKLRHTMKEMVDDYTRQLELRDDTIRNLEREGMQASNKEEVYELRDKVVQLNREIDILGAGAATTKHLKDEIERLNRQLLEKERYIDRQLQTQKNEWAEIYGKQSSTADLMSKEINMLKNEK